MLRVATKPSFILLFSNLGNLDNFIKYFGGDLGKLVTYEDCRWPLITDSRAQSRHRCLYFLPTFPMDGTDYGACRPAMAINNLLAATTLNGKAFGRQQQDGGQKNKVKNRNERIDYLKAGENQRTRPATQILRNWDTRHQLNQPNKFSQLSF